MQHEVAEEAGAGVEVGAVVPEQLHWELHRRCGHLDDAEREQGHEVFGQAPRQACDQVRGRGVFLKLAAPAQTKSYEHRIDWEARA